MICHILPEFIKDDFLNHVGLEDNPGQDDDELKSRVVDTADWVPDVGEDPTAALFNMAKQGVKEVTIACIDREEVLIYKGPPEAVKFKLKWRA